MHVGDRGVFECQVKQGIENEELDYFATSRRDKQNRSRMERRSAAETVSAGTWEGLDFGSPLSGVSGQDLTGGKRVDPQERMQQEMLAKWQKIEALRARDRKRIVERVERAKDAREVRFKRLLSNVCGEGNLAQETAKVLRERVQYEDQRRFEYYEEWQRHVHQPLVEQAERHLNPPNRAFEQQRAGFKTVAWTLPDEEFKMTVKPHQDPSRRSIADHAWENAFHQTAENLLSGRPTNASSSSVPRSQSAPQLQASRAQPSASSKARHKDILDPTMWAQQKFQGTLYGHWAQTCESGPGFRRSLRGGSDVHIPDESDGVMAAGTRVSRLHGYGDKGVLKGECGSRGETSQFKRWHGTSSAAPAQDHFNFEQGSYVTDLEFPLGKRPPPPGTWR